MRGFRIIILRRQRILRILLLAVTAAVNPVFRVGQVKNMYDTLFDGCNAARVFAFDHVPQGLRKAQLLLADDMAVLYLYNGDIGIDVSQRVHVDVDAVLDLDDVFLTHFVADHILD